MILPIAALLLQIQIAVVPEKPAASEPRATAEIARTLSAKESTLAGGTDASPSAQPDPAAAPSIPDLPAPERALSLVALPLSRPVSPSPDHRLRAHQGEWIALAIATHSAATFDAWSTRRAISTGYAEELNPTLRPFAGNSSLYVAIQVGPLFLDFLGRRMMTSQHGWARHTWWVLQAASAAASIASGAHNLTIH